ncbi:MAG: DUF309 domain-containing protein [Planctomycetes bacterium]|nr:DUF309 domain-containing protein [Planctomycetota bacterium]
MSDLPERVDDPRVLEGLRLLLTRRYFEAHESLEESWSEMERGEPWADVLQGLIQLSVALEHLKRDNAMGAFNVWQKSRAKLRKAPDWVAGIGVADWAEAVATHFTRCGIAERVKFLLEGGVADGAAHIEEASLPPLPPDDEWPIPELREELAARIPTA